MWRVEYTKKFLKELASLPQKTQSRVEAIVFEELETENPFELAKLEKLVGYKEGLLKKSIGWLSKARGKRQETKGKRQKARGKRQEARCVTIEQSMNLHFYLN